MGRAQTVSSSVRAFCNCVHFRPSGIRVGVYVILPFLFAPSHHLICEYADREEFDIVFWACTLHTYMCTFVLSCAFLFCR
jgi:hypothetical protein